MSTVDIVLGVFILALALRGLIRGAIREIFSVVALAIGIGVSYMFGKQFGNIIAQHITMLRAIAYDFAFFIIFLVAYLLSLFVGYILASVIKAIQLGWIDRILGFFLGGAKAIMLIGVIAIFISGFSDFPFVKNLDKALKKNSLIYRKTSNCVESLGMQRLINEAKKLEVNTLTTIAGGSNER